MAISAKTFEKIFFLKPIFSEDETYHGIRFRSVYNSKNNSKDRQQQQQTTGNYHQETGSHDHVSAKHSTNKVNLSDMKVDENSNDSCSSQLQLHHMYTYTVHSHYPLNSTAVTWQH